MPKAIGRQGTSGVADEIESATRGEIFSARRATAIAVAIVGQNTRQRDLDLRLAAWRHLGLAGLVIAVLLAYYRSHERSLRRNGILRREREQERRHLTEAQAIANLGSWQLNVADHSLYWSDEVYRIFGLTPGRARTGCRTAFGTGSCGPAARSGQSIDRHPAGRHGRARSRKPAARRGSLRPAGPCGFRRRAATDDRVERRGPADRRQPGLRRNLRDGRRDLARSTARRSGRHRGRGAGLCQPACPIATTRWSGWPAR